MSQIRWMTNVVNKIKRMKKEDYIVLVLVGILLVIIALPTETTKEQGQETEGKSFSKEVISENLFLEENMVGNSVKTNDNTRYYNEDSFLYGLSYAENMEKRVEEILKKVAGAGNVSVMITLSNLGEEIVEKDTEMLQSSMEETDAVGGKRAQQEKTQMYETIYTVDSEGNNIPYVVQTRLPRVTGVVVLTEGAEDKLVKENIIEALEVLFNISEHKIKVIKMKS